MPQHKKPTTTDTLIKTLYKAVDAAGQDAANGNSYLSDALVAQVQEALSRFEPLHTTVDTYKSARKKAVERAEPATAELKSELRLLWNFLASYIQRRKAPASYFTDFGLPSNGAIPQVGSRSVWIARGQQALSGYHKMMSEGYSLPFSTDALQQALYAAQEAHREVEEWKGRVQAAERARRQGRPDAEDTYRLLYSRLREALRHASASHARAIMRRYGVVFTYTSDEAALAQAEAPEGESTGENTGENTGEGSYAVPGNAHIPAGFVGHTPAGGEAHSNGEVAAG